MTRSSRSAAPGSEGHPAHTGLRFPRAARIRSARDIRRVLASGRRYAGPFVDVFVVSSDHPRPRAAVIVPRYGNTAVARNRVRRRLKELLRTRWMLRAHRTGRAVDLILRAKPAAYGVSYRRLMESLETPLDNVCKQR